MLGGDRIVTSEFLHKYQNRPAELERLLDKEYANNKDAGVSDEIVIDDPLIQKTMSTILKNHEGAACGWHDDHPHPHRLLFSHIDYMIEAHYSPAALLWLESNRSSLSA